MTDILRHFSATPEQVEAARAAAEAIPGGAGMFTVPYPNEEGVEPTHYISSGFVSPELVAALEGLCMVTDPTATLTPEELL